MKIDTLILGGCSTKIPTYVGIFKALRDLHIIDEKLQGIKHIISCSIGLLVSLYLLLEVNLQVQESCILEANFSKLIYLVSKSNSDSAKAFSKNGIVFLVSTACS